MFCKECSNRLTVLYRRNLDYWSVNCNRYSRDPVRGRCYSHFYPYNYLKELNNEVVKSVHKETNNINKTVKNLEVEKEKITKRINTLYDDRCDGVISAEVYKELAKESETKLKEINDLIDNEKIKKYKIKKRVDVLPDYTKKIKKLLDLNKPKKELIDTLVDKIVIDKDRNITIYFKYDIVPVVSFKYENRNLARNPYGRKGKNQYSKD